MRAGLDIRGGGPASRETPLLNPLMSAQTVHAIVLAGGSAFGLDAAGGVIVADQRRRQVTLFRQAREPICLVSEGLRRPLGVACGPQGQLLVADAEDGDIKVYQSHLELD